MYCDTSPIISSKWCTHFIFLHWCFQKLARSTTLCNFHQLLDSQKEAPPFWSTCLRAYIRCSTKHAQRKHRNTLQVLVGSGWRFSELQMAIGNPILVGSMTGSILATHHLSLHSSAACGLQQTGPQKSWSLIFPHKKTQGLLPGDAPLSLHG